MSLSLRDRLSEPDGPSGLDLLPAPPRPACPVTRTLPSGRVERCERPAGHLRFGLAHLPTSALAADDPWAAAVAHLPSTPEPF